MVKFLGNTDDVTACDCCGRQDLKSTVALSINDAEPVYYGVVCAARALSTDARTIKAESRKADRERADQERAEARKRMDAENAPWFVFLAANGKGGDTFRQIESLGGYGTARALYAAEVARG